ncbi:MAG: HAMP domain-containing sensor histidine kinase, partial [Bacilli bacterium]|nr:HAMP domain-containing sensor histidine kinase [Bacilli bacterium]MDD4282469.1 HAMP domain-containing sensor histidine kinase [Bacilli bacterium]
MRNIKDNLLNQLISIGIIVFGIIFFSLWVLIPRVMLPIYEKQIYSYLKQPLEFINLDISSNEIADDVAYLCIHSDNTIYISDNLSLITSATPKQIIDNINSEYGKFTYLGKKHYYYTSYSDNMTKISITDNTYIVQMRQDIIYTIFPILLITFLLIISLMILWASNLVLKIKHLKDKVDNIDNDDYIDNYKFKENDELSILSRAIDDMHFTLNKQEEYKNQMYQNISHDFKTPLTVIKSYIEAIEDGVQDTESGSVIIKEQLKKLENKVESLLYLNKLNYIIDKKNYKNEIVDVTKIISSSIEKFKYERPDIKWEVKINDNKINFNGTSDMWEAIIDNMLQNFIRYAEQEIKITIKNNKITFYNDGPNLDETIMSDLFTPYKKGIKGQFGLGLSIIRKTLCLVGYEIVVKNEKKGVTF